MRERSIRSARVPGRRIRIFLGICLALAVAVGVVSLWLGQKAQETATMMETFPWINNDRCAALVAELPAPGEAFRFAVFGDVQIGTAQLPRLFAALAEQSPVAFIVQTGDAVSHADPAHYNLFLYELAGGNLTLPMFVIPGNHDIRGDSSGLFEKYFGPREMAFTYGNSLFVLLDNSMEPFDDARYARLEDALRNHPDVQHRFLFMHIQPIHWEGDGKSPVEQHYERLFDLLRRYRVDYVFTGNWHGYHREKRDATVFIVNGRGGDFDHDERVVPCYFTLIEVDGGSVADRYIELPPKMSVALKSLLVDWLIAHLGESMAKSSPLAIGLLLVMACGSALCIISTKTAKPDRMRNQQDTGD
jgi:predicted phosphodiesterase